MKNVYIKVLFLLCCSRGWWRMVKKFWGLANSGTLTEGDKVNLKVVISIDIPEGIEAEKNPTMEVIPRVRSYATAPTDRSKRRICGFNQGAGEPSDGGSRVSSSLRD